MHSAYNNQSLWIFLLSLTKVPPDSLLPTMEEQIPFKNLHSREYSGHKKKVPFCSPSLYDGKQVQSLKLFVFVAAEYFCLCTRQTLSQCFCFNSDMGISLSFPKGALCGLELHWHETCFWLCGSNCSNLAYWATWACKLNPKAQQVHTFFFSTNFLL